VKHVVTNQNHRPSCGILKLFGIVWGGNHF
jgi:hypothetical protein